MSGVTSFQPKRVSLLALEKLRLSFAHRFIDLLASFTHLVDVDLKVHAFLPVKLGVIELIIFLPTRMIPKRGTCHNTNKIKMLARQYLVLTCKLRRIHKLLLNLPYCLEFIDQKVFQLKTILILFMSSSTNR